MPRFATDGSAAGAASSSSYELAVGLVNNYSSGVSLDGATLDNVDQYIWVTEVGSTTPTPIDVSKVDYFYGSGTPPSDASLIAATLDNTNPLWVRDDPLAGFDFQGSTSGVPRPWPVPAPPVRPNNADGGGTVDVGSGAPGARWIAARLVTASGVEVIKAEFTLSGVAPGTTSTALPWALDPTSDARERMSVHFGRGTVAHLAAEVELNRQPGSGNSPLYVYGAGAAAGSSGLSADDSLQIDQITNFNTLVSHCPSLIVRNKMIDAQGDSAGGLIQNNQAEQRARFQETIDGLNNFDLDRIIDPVVAFANANPTKPVWWSWGKEAAGNFRPDWMGPNPDKFVEAFQYIVDRCRARGAGANCIFMLDLVRRVNLHSNLTNPFTQIFDPLRSSGHLQGLFIDVYDRVDAAARSDHLDDDPALFIYPGLGLHSAAQRANTWIDTADAFDYSFTQIGVPYNTQPMIQYALDNDLYVGFPEIGWYYGNSSSRMIQGGQSNPDLIDYWMTQIDVIHQAGNLALYTWFMHTDGGVGFSAWDDPAIKAKFIERYDYAEAPPEPPTPNPSSGIFTPPGTEPKIRGSVTYPTNVPPAPFTPYLYFIADSRRMASGGSSADSDYSGSAGIQAGAYARYHADRFLVNGTTPPANVATLINAWSGNFSPTLSFHTNCTSTNLASACSANGRMATAFHVMAALFGAAADIGHIPANATAWLNRLIQILDTPTWHIGHNFRSSALVTACAAEAAVNAAGIVDDRTAQIAALTSVFIFESMVATDGSRNVAPGSNAEEGRIQGIHYGMFESNALSYVRAFLLNRGTDIPAAARTRWQAQINFFWDIWVDYGLDGYGAFNSYVATQNGLTYTDNGTLYSLGEMAVLQRLEKLGMKPSGKTIPASLRNLTNVYYGYNKE